MRQLQFLLYGRRDDIESGRGEEPKEEEEEEKGGGSGGGREGS